MDLTLAAAAGVASQPVIKKALELAGKTIERNSDKLAASIVDKTVVALQVGFGDYLTSSYERCRYFKSILPPSQPREVIANYVNVDLTVGDERYTDDSIVDSIHLQRSIVITGLAGSGKSMFLKYLTVRHFEQPKGFIPLFIELRKLNSLSEKNLLSFIRSSCSSASNSVTEKQFELALRAGAFIIILDGFDEIAHENREQIQDQIISLRRLYPKLTVVISSRPDDRFLGWAAFKTYRVQELTKSQCISLIDSFDYDVGVKKRFKSEVNKSLYESHKSFLSFPLLVSIMLLTYEEFAEIPNKKHVFYRQAFDTLLQKHDASKEQYQRKTKTGLQLEEFRAYFAAFCAFSYLEEKYAFSDDSLIETAKLSAKYVKNSGELATSVSEKDFVDDLFEAVCMLQKDGLETAFVHRSFQEYFSAVFVTKLPPEKMRKLLENFAQRQSDSPVGMALDMAREVVESAWVAPTIRTLIAQLTDESLNYTERFMRYIESMGFYSDGDIVRFASYSYDSTRIGILETICNLYAVELSDQRIVRFGERIDKEKLRLSLLRPENENKRHYSRIRALLESDKGFDPEEPHFVLSADDEWWFSEFEGASNIDKLGLGLKKVLKSIETRDRRRKDIIADLL